MPLLPDLLLIVDPVSGDGFQPGTFLGGLIGGALMMGAVILAAFRPAKAALQMSRQSSDDLITSNKHVVEALTAENARVLERASHAEGRVTALEADLHRFVTDLGVMRKLLTDCEQRDAEKAILLERHEAALTMAAAERDEMRKVIGRIAADRPNPPTITNATPPEEP